MCFSQYVISRAALKSGPGIYGENTKNVPEDVIRRVQEMMASIPYDPLSHTAHQEMLPEYGSCIIRD